MDNSKKYTLNRTDLQSIAINTGIVALSAVLPQLIEVVGNIDFGANTPVIVMVLGLVLKTLQRFVSGR